MSFLFRLTLPSPEGRGGIHPPPANHSQGRLSHMKKIIARGIVPHESLIPRGAGYVAARPAWRRSRGWERVTQAAGQRLARRATARMMPPPMATKLQGMMMGGL